MQCSISIYQECLHRVEFRVMLSFNIQRNNLQQPFFIKIKIKNHIFVVYVLLTIVCVTVPQKQNLLPTQCPYIFWFHYFSLSLTVLPRYYWCLVRSALRWLVTSKPSLMTCPLWRWDWDIPVNWLANMGQFLNWIKRMNKNIFKHVQMKNL